MPKTQVRYYPVGNGAMTLIKLDDEYRTSILIDMCILNAADDKEDKGVYDVASDLRKNLERGPDNRLHLNLLIHSHGDDDHVHGIQNHFWLGDPKNYKSNSGEPEKIIVDEIWSSTRYRKYDTQNFSLGDDAKALSKEIRRRVGKLANGVGDLVHILGDNLLDDDDEQVPQSIRYGVTTTITTIAGHSIPDFSVQVLGPLAREQDEDDKTFDDKNRGSLIIRIDRTATHFTGSKRVNSLLFGDDTEVRTWERLYEKGWRERLKYDLMLAPHHCSWHSLSHEKSEAKDAEVSDNARLALNNRNNGAYIILSCLSDKDEGDESKKRGRAKARAVYESIVGAKNVLCTGEHKIGGTPVPIVFSLTASGVSLEHMQSPNAFSVASRQTIGEPLPHG